MAFPTGLRVVKRTEPVGNLQNPFKGVLIRGVRLLVHDPVGLAVIASRRFRGLLSKGHGARCKQQRTKEKTRGESPHLCRLIPSSLRKRGLHWPESSGHFFRDSTIPFRRKASVA